MNINEKIDWAHLYSLWDGFAANTKEICGSCGVCCHRTEKPFLPGEFEYVKQLSGVDNFAWSSDGCLCQKTGVKPVICRTYPLMIDVDLTGWYVTGLFYGGYTGTCKTLDFTPSEIWEKITAFLDYLFSFQEIRTWWFLSYNFLNTKKVFEELLSSHNMSGDLSDEELTLIVINWFFGFYQSPYTNLFALEVIPNVERDGGDNGYSNLLKNLYDKKLTVRMKKT